MTSLDDILLCSNLNELRRNVLRYIAFVKCAINRNSLVFAECGNCRTCRNWNWSN
jgi:hypothetical protein